MTRRETIADGDMTINLGLERHQLLLEIAHHSSGAKQLSLTLGHGNLLTTNQFRLLKNQRLLTNNNSGQLAAVGTANNGRILQADRSKQANTQRSTNRRIHRRHRENGLAEKD